MNEYQIYGFGEDDTVVSDALIEAECEIDAIHSVRWTPRPNRTEIWCGERKVRRIPANAATRMHER